MRRLQGMRMNLDLSATWALVLIGAIQLALRHSNFPFTSAEICMELIEVCRQGFASEPAILAVIEAGFDPAQDSPSDYVKER